jgi:plastocyanin
MTDTGISLAPQQYDILIFAGIINYDHPEQSTLTLKLRDPYPVVEGECADVAETQQQHADFKPGDDINVKPGDRITWIIQDPDISSILVMDDNKNKNVFESNPSPVKGSTNWSGIIDRTINGRKEETYSICWSQQGMTYCYDPKITVNT